MISELKIVFIILVSLIGYGTVNAQNNTVNINSLVIGGIYEVVLVNNSDFIGEVIQIDTGAIKFNISGYIEIVMKKDIKKIQIHKEDYFEPYSYQGDKRKMDEKKFKYVIFLNASFDLPTGGLNEIYSPGFGIHASVYNMFEQVIGIGSEISYDYIYGKNSYYSQNEHETDGISYFRLNVNLLAGNFKPGNRFLIYGFIGVGFILFNEGKTREIYIDQYNNYHSYTHDWGWAGVDFNYGAGAGTSYLLSKRLGINFEIQFNKVNNDVYYYYDTQGFNGYLSFKAGIIIIDL